MLGTEFRIVVLTRDRCEMLLSCLDSLRAQTDSNFEVTISCNNSDCDLRSRVSALAGSWDLLFWDDLDLTEHLNSIAAVYQGSGYVVFFHDDDLFYKEFVFQMKEVITRNPGHSAYAANSGVRSFRDQDGHDVKLLCQFTSDILVVEDPRRLLAHYMRPGLGGAPAFGGYCYDLSGENSLPHIRDDVGRYFDTVFLYDLTCSGSLLWVRQPLTQLSLHEASISEDCGVADYKIFYRWVLSEFGNSSAKQLGLAIYRIRKFLYFYRHNRSFRSKVRLRSLVYNIAYLFFHCSDFRAGSVKRLFKGLISSG